MVPGRGIQRACKLRRYQRRVICSHCQMIVRCPGSAYLLRDIDEAYRQFMIEDIPAQAGRPFDNGLFAQPSSHYLMWLTSASRQKKSPISHKQPGPGPDDPAL